MSLARVILLKTLCTLKHQKHGGHLLFHSVSGLIFLRFCTAGCSEGRVIRPISAKNWAGLERPRVTNQGEQSKCYGQGEAKVRSTEGKGLSAQYG